MADGGRAGESRKRIENKESQRATSRRCARGGLVRLRRRVVQVVGQAPERDKEKGHAPWANTD